MIKRGLARGYELLISLEMGTLSGIWKDTDSVACPQARSHPARQAVLLTPSATPIGTLPVTLYFAIILLEARPACCTMRSPMLNSGETARRSQERELIRRRGLGRGSGETSGRSWRTRALQAGPLMSWGSPRTRATSNPVPVCLVLLLSSVHALARHAIRINHQTSINWGIHPTAPVNPWRLEPVPGRSPNQLNDSQGQNNGSET